MLKPQNIVQAAHADLARKRRNLRRAELNVNNCEYTAYEPYAFHRNHVRKANTAHELMLLALMNHGVATETAKPNTRLIYGDAQLLVAAIKLTSEVYQ